MSSIANLAALLILLLHATSDAAPSLFAVSGDAYRWEPSGVPAPSEGAIPFYGGLGTGDVGPKCRLADLDGDGDLDLFALERDGLIGVYRNEGSPAAPRLVPIGRDLVDLPLFDWFLFDDIDGDGDLDLFGGSGPRGEAIAFFRNTGGPVSPAFAYEADAAFLDSTEVVPRLGNTPSLVDLDGDGDHDLFYVEPALGIGAFHRNDGTTAAPLFRSQILGYGGLDTFVGASRRHGISITNFLDTDADLDADLLIGDAFNTNLWYFRNDGPGDSAVFTRISTAYLDLPDTVPVSTLWTESGDLDGDGAADLIVGPSEDHGKIARSLYLYRNVGTPDSAAFAYAGDSLLSGIDLGVRVHPAAADLDGDGDADLILSPVADPGVPSMVLLENTGTPSAPRLERRTSGNPLAAAVHDSLDSPSPVFADMDGDGDLDLLAGARIFRRQVFYFENVGTTKAAEFVFRATLLDHDPLRLNRRPDSEAAPGLADLDDDGDLDLLVGERGLTGRPRLFYYRNDGYDEAERHPRFEWVASDAGPSFGIDVAADSIRGGLAPFFVDADGDALADLVLGSDDGRLRGYRNLGPVDPGGLVRFAREPEAFAGIDVGRDSAPATFDAEGDGDLDLVVGEENGGANFYRNVDGGGIVAALAAVAVEETIRVSWTSGAAAGARFRVFRSEASGPLTPVTASPLEGGPSFAVLDTAGVFPGNRYDYRVQAELPDATTVLEGPVFAEPAIPAVTISDAIAVTGPAGGATVRWRASRVFRGLAFRLERRRTDGVFVGVEGAENIPAAEENAVDDPQGSGSGTYRISGLYTKAGAFAAMPESLLAPVTIQGLGDLPFRLQRPRPDPSAGRPVSFLLDLPQDAAVVLHVFDLSGRRIRTLGPTALPAGPERAIVWDGRDDDAEEVSAGIYAYRVDAGGRTATGRIVWLR